MPQYCCVPLCRNSKGGHSFPKRDQGLRQKWIIAIKREDPVKKKLWEPGPSDKVCSDHFTPDDYNCTLLGERRRLKGNAVPSKFKFNATRPVSLCAERRKKRGERKERRCQSSEACVPDIGCEVSVMSDDVEISVTVDITEEETNSSPSVSCQCNSLTDMNSHLSIENFEDNPRVVKYYTGFQNYDHLMLMFNVLGPAAYNLNYQCSLLKPEDQFFLTLMKLRQAKDDIELSLLFNISESTVSQIIITWINFLYFQLKEIDIWPQKSVVLDHMPLNFGKQFRSTRVVLDATEIPITKPKNVLAQSSTYSTYKGRNTLKTMIGCTPRGLVSYIGPSYGGSASDRQIIERSPLCKDLMFEKGDSIMADRGIMVQDLFSSKDVFVNTPTMLKGKSQLEPEMVVRDRRISSKRIHVERVIGLGKTYKILKKELPPSKRLFGSRIIYICFMLSNFRTSIVNGLA